MEWCRCRTKISPCAAGESEVDGRGGIALATDPEFVNVKCPKCGGPARRGVGHDGYVRDSSWYFYRYCDPHNDKQPFDPAKAAYLVSIDQYIGGITHAILHLMYSRFWCKVMRIWIGEARRADCAVFTQGMVQKGGVAMSKSRGTWWRGRDAEKYGADTEGCTRYCGAAGEGSGVERREY